MVAQLMLIHSFIQGRRQNYH